MGLAAAEAVAEEPRIVHAIPGRVRVHLPDWDGRGQRGLEAQLRGLRGVLGARANPLTRNVLVRFDPAETDEQSILGTARTAAPDEAEDVEREPEAPPVQRERRDPSGSPGRARIAVRGMDRNPELARRVVERLESFPTVRATASQLTGRVLVEFDERRVELEDLVSEVAGVELPEVPGEDRPAHPMDRERLLQSGVRTSGAAAGLGLLGVRRLFGLTGPPIAASGPATVASAIAVLESFPVTKRAAPDPRE